MLAWGDAGRVVVPISQVALPDGDIRYSVPVTVGGSVTIPALLDTGSTGLRIFRDRLAPGDYTDTGFATFTAFSAGDKLSGTVGTAVIGVGGAATDAPVPFELVDGESCMDFRPRCGAAMLAARDYGIGGDGIAGQGFGAILGLSLVAAADSENPLLHMGAKRWMIVLPEPVAGAVGALIINPDDADMVNAQSFHLSGSPAAGWQDTLPGCLNNTSSGQQICGPVILDTGSPGMVAYVPGGFAAPLWRAGDAASLSFATGYSSNLTMPFLVDRNPGTGLLQQPASGTTANILSGFLPFFYNAILYDGAAGVIALQPRPDAPNPESNPSPQTEPSATVEVIQMNAPDPHAPALPVVITPSP